MRHGFVSAFLGGHTGQLALATALRSGPRVLTVPSQAGGSHGRPGRPRWVVVGQLLCFGVCCQFVTSGNRTSPQRLSSSTSLSTSPAFPKLGGVTYWPPRVHGVPVVEGLLLEATVVRGLAVRAPCRRAGDPPLCPSSRFRKSPEERGGRGVWEMEEGAQKTPLLCTDSRPGVVAEPRRPLGLWDGRGLCGCICDPGLCVPRARTTSGWPTSSSPWPSWSPETTAPCCRCWS